ncbi:hypothetical protein ABT052_07215 [Streptomyces sp. NPDC002766]|uniref:hypothetical protein n=1 Tax=unclassified Streptomyces TaxID=2593676 RepID=UPI00331AADD6
MTNERPTAGRARSPWGRRGMRFGLGLLPLGAAAVGSHHWMGESWTTVTCLAVGLNCMGVVVQEIAERRAD